MNIITEPLSSFDQSPTKNNGSIREKDEKRDADEFRMLKHQLDEVISRVHIMERQLKILNQHVLHCEDGVSTRSRNDHYLRDKDVIHGVAGQICGDDRSESTSSSNNTEVCRNSHQEQQDEQKLPKAMDINNNLKIEINSTTDGKKGDYDEEDLLEYPDEQDVVTEEQVDKNEEEMANQAPFISSARTSTHAAPILQQSFLQQSMLRPSSFNYHNSTTGRRQSNGLLTSWLSHDTHYTIQNTKTIHMCSVVLLADYIKEEERFDEINSRSSNSNSPVDIVETIDTKDLRRKRIKSKFFSFLSLTVMSIQLLVLSFVIWESTHTTCSAHTDCQIGSYCHGTPDYAFIRPRCHTCTVVDKYYSNTTTNCDSFMIDVQDMGHTVLWFESNFEPNCIFDEDSIGCAAIKYCQDTTIVGEDYNESSGFFRLVENQLSVDQIIVLIFISALFGNTISKDLTEASTEDATLKTIISTMKIDISSVYFSVTAIRLSLRVRQMVLPWFIGSATISVILTESLSGKNIILNFLAVSFILETDNMLVKFLLEDHQKEELDRILSNTPVEKVMSRTWSRAHALAVPIFIVVIVININFLLQKFFSTSLFVAMAILTVGGFICSWLCWNLMHVKKWGICDWNVFLEFFIEYCRASAAIYFGVIWGYVSALIIVPYLKEAPFLATYCISSVLGFLGIEYMTMKWKDSECFESKYGQSALVILFVILLISVVYYTYSHVYTFYNFF